MKAFIAVDPFLVRAEVPPSQRTLFEGEEAAPAEDCLLRRLEEMPPGGLMPIDFAGVKVSSEAARQLLRRAFRRVTGGEVPDRYLLLMHLGRSRYNVEVMLEAEEITFAERADDGATAKLIGKVEPAMRETYEYLCARKSATAKDVFEHFGLNNISTATNRLTGLAKMALARRVEEQPVAGGGRQYVYAGVR
jgi:hypothetical protein